ncbi:MAG: ribosome biogenesis GTPase Der [Bacilli bacterium]|nr:ribosome biogenesis GTPase Der [Bacilli bacterium]
MKIPVVALIGRPNVGKSTLFNKLVGKRISIIEDTPGVTRDRIYGMAEHKGIKFHLIDTGGITLNKDVFNEDIRLQAQLAIDEADLILFVVDGKDGVTSEDILIRDILRKNNKNIIVLVNKFDNKESKENMYDFYELGFEKNMYVSSEHNVGIYELLDEVVSNFDYNNETLYEEDVLKFCVIGRPNVGKSSLVNCILNEERSIVSEISGTTRDSIDTPFEYNNRKFVVIDTAGIKKQGKVYENIERYSILRSLKAIDRSDVCLVVINAEEGIIEVDKHVAGYAIESGRAVVLVVNKWDKAKKDMITFKKELRNHFPFVEYAPIVFLSALTKKRVGTLMPEVIKVYDNWNKEVKTSTINNIIVDALALNSPPSYKGRRLKIYYVNQIENKPPKFLFQVNDKKLIHFSYERYIENKIRESIDFEGTPIVMVFKNRGEK